MARTHNKIHSYGTRRFVGETSNLPLSSTSLSTNERANTEQQQPRSTSKKRNPKHHGALEASQTRWEVAKDWAGRPLVGTGRGSATEGCRTTQTSHASRCVAASDSLKVILGVCVLLLVVWVLLTYVNK